MNENIPEPESGPPSTSIVTMPANPPMEPDQLGRAVLFRLGNQIAHAVIDRIARFAKDHHMMQTHVLQILTAWPQSGSSNETVHSAQRQRLLIADNVTYTRNLTLTFHPQIPETADRTDQDLRALVARDALRNTHRRLYSPEELVSLTQVPITRELIYECLASEDRLLVHVYGPGAPDFTQLPGQSSEFLTAITFFLPPPEPAYYSQMFTDLPNLRWLILGPVESTIDFPAENFPDRSPPSFEPGSYLSGLIAGQQRAYDELLCIVQPYMAAPSSDSLTRPVTVLRQINLVGTVDTRSVLALIVARSMRPSNNEPATVIISAMLHAHDGGDFRSIQLHPESLMIAMANRHFNIRNEDNTALDCMYRKFLLEHAHNDPARHHIDWGLEQVQSDGTPLHPLNPHRGGPPSISIWGNPLGGDPHLNRWQDYLAQRHPSAFGMNDFDVSQYIDSEDHYCLRLNQFRQ